MNAREVIEKALRSYTEGEDAAEIVERILGEYGFVILPRSEVEAIREVLEPFAKAGELFPDDAHEFAFDQCIYRPAAGDEYALTGGHLRDARKALRKLKSGGE